ncbi:hypothetical protein [Microbacterium sp. SORGH_AS_0888]|uniref:hypothetical protein n=1 Tax=Microbacterium sp. SORGH_AS_0888 TaxID=3041791 RepID=UPI0027896FAF|nr:hypothetical protein [Microbacterium sp. SORGH_AS_0888]MDQ1128379.1 hypothetical protein [Microbacterium sp. SORGH_AS_0888]
MTTQTLERTTHATARDVVRLHFAQRVMLLATPPAIMGIAFVVTAIVCVILWRMGSVPGSAEWAANSRNNPAVVWSLPGFFGWIGVQTVSLTFPLALSLGSTRRTFVTGTILTHIAISLYVAVMMLVLLGLELATDHWFVGVYVTDVYLLGDGDPFRLALTTFLGTLLVLSVGGAMAASWVRVGARGPLALAAGAIIVLGLVVIALVPLLPHFRLWWLVVAAVVMIAIALVGQYTFLRRATVR